MTRRLRGRPGERMVPGTIRVQRLRMRRGDDDLRVVIVSGLVPRGPGPGEREMTYGTGHDWFVHVPGDEKAWIASGSSDGAELARADVETAVDRALADPRVRKRLERAKRRVKIGMRVIRGGRRDSSGTKEKDRRMAGRPIRRERDLWGFLSGRARSERSRSGSATEHELIEADDAGFLAAGLRMTGLKDPGDRAAYERATLKLKTMLDRAEREKGPRARAQLQQAAKRGANLARQEFERNRRS